MPEIRNWSWSIPQRLSRHTPQITGAPGDFPIATARGLHRQRRVGDGQRIRRARREEVGTANNSLASAPADILVIFGITGDLAKKMTYHSLYRLPPSDARLPDRRRCPRRVVRGDPAGSRASRDRGRRRDDRRRRVLTAALGKEQGRHMQLAGDVIDFLRRIP
jgi:hypothetical protein